MQRLKRTDQVRRFDLSVKMINWNKETKKRIQAVLGTTKTSFYYGFIPLIIYLGIAKYSVFLTTCMMYMYTKLLVFILLGILTNTI